jgi:iron complex transport system permease protein
VRSLRVPRTAVGLAIGASLAVAGAVMQGVTRNPLADPFILGVSSGASFALVTAIY